jgi:hypothetical protein
MNLPRVPRPAPRKCTREICDRPARGAIEQHRHPSTEPLAYCSPECHHIARVCAYNTTTPALDSWSWLPAKPREVRAPTTD